MDPSLGLHLRRQQVILAFCSSTSEFLFLVLAIPFSMIVYMPKTNFEICHPIGIGSFLLNHPPGTMYKQTALQTPFTRVYMHSIDSIPASCGTISFGPK